MIYICLVELMEWITSETCGYSGLTLCDGSAWWLWACRPLRATVTALCQSAKTCWLSWAAAW